MDINLKVGSDISELYQSLGKTRDLLVENKKAAEQAFMASAEGSEQASAAVNDYIKITKQSAEQVSALEKKLEELKKTQKDAYSTAEIKKLEDELAKLRGETKKYGDEAANAGKKAASGTQALANALALAKTKLAGLKAGSPEFNKLSAEIKAAEVAMESFGEETEDSSNKLESARKRLKEFQVTLQNLKLEGLDQTQVYKDLKKEAGSLRDTISDVNEEINAVASDTNSIDNVVRGVQLATNAFGIYEGVVALTGQRNEEFEKTLIRLNALLTISNSLQQVMTELKRKDNVLTVLQINLQKLYTLVIGTSTGALKAFRLALAATGIGLVVFALITLIEKMGLFSDEAEEAAQKQKEFNDELARAADVGKNAGLAFLRNEEALAVARAKAAGKTEKEIVTIQESFAKERLRVLKDNLAERKRLGQDTLDIEQEIADQETDIEVQRLESQVQFAEKAKAQREKESQQRLQEAQERNKRIIDLEKQLADARINALSEGRDKNIAIENKQFEERIAALKENLGKAYGKELALIKQNIEQEEKNHKMRLLAIDAEYYKNAQAALIQAQDAINGVLVTGEEAEIEQTKKKYANILKAIEDASKEIQTSIQAGLGDPFADNEALARLRGQTSKLTEEQQKEISQIRLKYRLERLEKDEELAIAENDLLQIQGVDQERLEEIKEQGRLDIIVSFAKKRIELLKAIGTDEAKIQIAQLEKVILDAAKKQPAKKDSQQDLFALLGLKLDEKTKQDIVNGFGSIFNSINTLFSQSVQNRIDESQRLIDALQDQIDEQEEIVDREKELAEKGYANNLSLEEKKLADLKRQKEQEQATLKKAQQEQAKFAAIQVALNGIVSASNLAVSAANYFKESSKFGPVAGTILALAAIATMITTFVATKKQAESVAKFHHGGGLDLTNQRTSHERGGLGIYDGATGKKVAEARGGEYGYFFKDGQYAKRFEPLFDAINAGISPQMPQLNTFDLKGLRLIPEALLSKNTGPQQGPVTGSKSNKTDELLLEIANNTGQQTSYENGYRVEKTKNHIRRIKL